MNKSEIKTATCKVLIELARAETYLQEAHEDIVKNFDPKVLELKEKMKAVVAPRALGGLIEEDTGG